jgi:hypothetical protein
LKEEPLLSAVCGILFTFISAVFSNNPGPSIPELDYRGLPLPWVITDLNSPNKFITTNLCFDLLFNSVFIFFAVLLMTSFAKWFSERKWKN